MRVCIVGGSKGIGGATARRLAKQGNARLAICARDRDRLESTARELGESIGPERVISKQVDIVEGDAVVQFVELAAKEFNGLDALIWVAGTSLGGGDAAAWTRDFEVNVTTGLRALQTAVPFLEKSTNGSATFVITTAALEYFAPAGDSSYAPVKAALLNMARARAQSLGSKGIRVNAVSPAQTLSPGNMWDQLRSKEDPFYLSQVAQTALGRFVTADEVAHAIQFLTLATGITGANIVVDAGFTKAL